MFNKKSTIDHRGLYLRDVILSKNSVIKMCQRFFIDVLKKTSRIQNLGLY
jgi:hypothetical protein